MENEKQEIFEKDEEVKEETGMVLQDFGHMSKNSNTKADIFTNITDTKKIFNLDSRVDNLLNDMENSVIEVKEVLIKRYEKPLAEPVIDEVTGEVIKDKDKDTEVKMACILIDTNDVSYATGSKVFTIQMMRYLQMFKKIPEEGLLIKIVKTKQASGNKTLGFELV